MAYIQSTLWIWLGPVCSVGGVASYLLYLITKMDSKQESVCFNTSLVCIVLLCIWVIFWVSKGVVFVAIYLGTKF